MPIISNRTVEQTVRLRENETSLLAGYMNVQGTRTLNGWPGISEIEGIGSLLGEQMTDNTADEVLILITPRRLNPAPRTEHVLYAGHAPSQGAGSVGATFEEQTLSPNEPPAPLVAPQAQKINLTNEPPPQPITSPHKTQTAAVDAPRPQPNR